MDGKLKIGMLIFICLFWNCKKQNNIDNNGKELITQNINVLIDSIESFDMRKISRPEKFKELKIEKFRVGLLDSVLIENVENNRKEFSILNLNKDNLINFRSGYKISIVKSNNYDINVLFVSFSNFKINTNEASVDVKKVIGISMIKNRYYFKKEKGLWVFKKKQFIGLG